MALNPGEAPHLHMFIWSNLFLSLGFDHAEHYLPLGGDSAAHAAAVCDLRGTQVNISKNQYFAVNVLMTGSTILKRNIGLIG